MRKVNELLQLKKVSMNHNQVNKDSGVFWDIERTTSYETSQFRRSMDLTSYRRTSTSSKGENSISPNLQRRNSFVTFESNDLRLSIREIKNIDDPKKHICMTELQYKIWRTVTKCQKSQLEQTYIIDIIVISQGQEYEFKFDLSKLSCFMTIKELCEQIHLIFIEQRNQKLQDPQLHILIGIIKTQRLDGDIRLFELINLLLNGQKTLILQQGVHNLL
ncbi:unnamed protein product [Paramecium sonneborni]|uniref:Uncharacterized protein n=1 Tax=Paramecium sonneborni TaxID=65129 RepID=A0A8S1NFJ8_9CILI|nr:unnamed protein product [Paramecium sonneborni]